MEVFCFCRQPEDTRPMIGCDSCKEWYHLECLDMSPKEAELLSEYFCPLCQSRDATDGAGHATTRGGDAATPKLPGRRLRRDAAKRADNYMRLVIAEERKTDRQQFRDLERRFDGEACQASDRRQRIGPKSTTGGSRNSRKRPRRHSSRSNEATRAEATRPKKNPKFGLVYDDEKANADVLNMTKGELLRELNKLEAEINSLELEVLASPEVDDESGTDDELEQEAWRCPENAVPICVDVRKFDFVSLRDRQFSLRGRLFDVIIMDPPWQLASANPTRGVAIGYDTLTDRDIENLPVPRLQDHGLLFIWVINAKYSMTLRMMRQWGYRFVDEITWVKTTVNRRLAKGHGFYLQHAKETVLVAQKGDHPPGMKNGVASDVIFAERRGQSQKPVEIYELIEKLVPNGHYLEIFGRRNNLRDNWVTVGNEL